MFRAVLYTYTKRTHTKQLNAIVCKNLNTITSSLRKAMSANNWLFGCLAINDLITLNWRFDMKSLSLKTKILAAAMSFAVLGGVSTTAVAASNLSDTRTNMMVTQSIEAANAKINANQAVLIAQSQVANAKAVGIHYGSRMDRSAGKGKPGDKAEQTQTANATTPSYHVMLINDKGIGYHVNVDASSGKVLANEKMKKPDNRRSHTNDKKRPLMQVPVVSLTQAMQAAQSKVGGEAVSAKFGMQGKPGHRGHHGKHMARGKQQMDTTKRPTPSYHIKVVNDDKVTFVKVDAQTGVVTDTKSMQEMQKMMQQHGKKGKRGEMR